MKKIILLSSLLVCNLAVAYEDESAEYKVSSNELNNAKYEVLDKAKQYAQSVACSTTFDEDSGEMTTVNNVYPLQYRKWSSNRGSFAGEGEILR